MNTMQGQYKPREGVTIMFTMIQDMKKKGCILAIIIALLIPIALYCWICWPRLVAKGASYECPYTYGPLAGAWLNLPNDSVAKIMIYSLEFVGRFSDKLEGQYTFINDSVLVVHWNRVNKHNSIYTEPYTDTLTIRGENFVRTKSN